MNNLRLFCLLLLLVPCHMALAGVTDFTVNESVFSSGPIPDSLFRSMQGRSFNEPAPVTREDLRLLTVMYKDFDGLDRKGQIVCNASIADDLLEIFRELYENAYPIESIRLIDDFEGDDMASMRADNTSCFNVRPKSAFKNGFSAHAYGLAIDINPLYNPYVRTRDGITRIEPEEAAPYIDRGKDFPHKIDREDLCCRLFRAHGFTWGGSWRSMKDYQHFEKAPDMNTAGNSPK